jgi:hypothetical protein
MSQKEFIPYDTIRNNALVLAHTIYREGFIPDVIYVSLRGGAYMGNVISEFFKFVRRGQRPVFYAAVVARSYTDIHQHDRVSVDGWTYSPEHLRNGDRVLLVDDIFESPSTTTRFDGTSTSIFPSNRTITVASTTFSLPRKISGFTISPTSWWVWRPGRSISSFPPDRYGRFFTVCHDGLRRA